jgi:hypothetical protein
MERLGWATVGAVFGGTAVWAATRFIARTQDQGEAATPETPQKHAKGLGQQAPTLSGATAASPRSSHQPNEGSVQSGTLGSVGGRNSEVGSGLGSGALPSVPKPPQK